MCDQNIFVKSRIVVTSEEKARRENRGEAQSFNVTDNIPQAVKLKGMNFMIVLRKLHVKCILCIKYYIINDFKQ